MNDQVIALIESKLKSLIDEGKAIERLAIYVAPGTEMAARSHVGTRYGFLRIMVNEYSRRGIAYILEDPTGKKGLGFQWVRGGPPKGS